MTDQPAQSGPGVADPPSAWPTGRLLSTVARRVERAWDTYLEQWSLTHASLPVLAILAGGPRSQRELARHLDVTEQTTSRMLLRLERAGYVRRQRHDEDRRRQVVAITPEGLRALGQLNDPEAIDAFVNPQLPEAQLRQLRALLVLMLEAEGAAPAHGRAAERTGPRA
ncbi:MarR family winged helix-turn-helix transcriptional regulator [Georgenia sp. SYP-B2076]|uniref:MarR family winged helix-turn-helix transcriptional regulator n=1 Tax=Georgenia sp. SYP-B2076 TaxID=2495881 RepID=UPI001F0C22F9|nr:MarR family transcriptional regulator [Georgenia sp. SYP-B2076]